ncbi:hypothetical protein [Pontimicrobium sp. IMCC45349]|uniref:TackOD1 domain-containing metal-binding protein n=1 Tax=Pontimicrobium sp. IMCC45349 TaxID=3391574 RepID=UPI00399FB5AE
MFKVVKNNNQKILTQGSLDYLIIEKWSNSLEDVISNCQAVIIATKETNWFNDIVLQLRTHKDKNVFLKPVFYKYDIKSEYIIHTDGLFEEDLSNHIVKAILDKVESVPQLQIEQNFDVTTRLIQFLYTREAKLSPTKNRYSKIGYVYPFIGLYFTSKEYEIEKQLQFLVNDEALNVQLKDKVQLCNDCHDSYLIYKETCPKCKSINLEAHDIIHHFTCAHVAPQEQFINNENDNLQCPKCNKHLRHIGIDYDKPSSVYNCNTCDHHFQVAQVVSECHSCNHVNSLEELIEVTIYDYELTMKAMLMAEGKYVINKTEEQDAVIIFNQLLDQEKERNFAKGYSSYLATVSLTGELLNILDSDFINSFWKDIKEIVKQYVANDLCYIKKGNSIQLLLLDVDEEKAEEVRDKMIYNMELLLSDNIKSHIKITNDLVNVKAI